MADDLARGGSKQPLEAKQTTAQSWADVDPDLDTEAISDPGSSSTSGTVSQNNMLHQSSDTEDLQTELGALTVDHGTSNCDDHPSLDQAPPTDRNGSPSLVRETPLSSKPRHESIHERRRREHEEYKQKRAADPSFVPNRGAFFMHDHRHSGAGANGFRPLGRGLNPGRAVVGGPFSPANILLREPDVTNGMWKHDMHETVVAEEPPSKRELANRRGRATADGAAQPARIAKPNPRYFRQEGLNHFTRLLPLSEMFPRVRFPSMAQATAPRKLLLRQHLFAPEHRPPMRRDRAIHIAIPGLDRRLVFPARERSFIFEHRGAKGRNGFTRATARSRRESVMSNNYGLVTPSTFSSRPSSVATHHRQSEPPMIAPLGSSTLDQTLLPNGRKAPSHMLREPPANSLAAGNRQGHDEVLSPTMPAVKLPSSGDGYSPNPITSASTVAVDHPRPQRSVDFPALVSFSRSSNTPTHSDHQPFHQQYPSYPPNHLAGQPGPYFYPPLPSQPIPMTGMHHIPQEAVHASAFHTAASQQPNPGPYYSPSAAYFYPMTEPNFMVPDPHLTQPFVEHNNFYMATPAMPVAAENPPITQAPRNVVAREMNGMVYYSDPAPADSSQESAVPKAATLDVEEAIPPEIAPGMVYFSHQNAGMDPYHYPAFYPTMHPLQMGDMKQDS